MEKLNSPLTEDELKKIDQFINEHIDELSKFSFETYENIKLFQPRVKNFDQYLKELEVNEKTRAWFYLFSSAKKERQKYLSARRLAKDNDQYNPKYLDTSTIQQPKSKKYTLNSVFILIGGVVLIVLIFLVLFSKPKEKNYDKCVVNGVQYFKDIGSYPKLSDGKHAENVVRERCNRSSVAFGSID